MLGELLELLHTCNERWTTLQATVHRRDDPDAWHAALEAPGRAPLRTSRPPGAPDPWSTEPDDEELTVTAAATGQVRVQYPASRDVVLSVVHPDGAYLHVEQDGTARRGDPEGIPAGLFSLGLLPAVVAPEAIGARYRIRFTGTGSVLGRECLLAHCTRRPTDQPRVGPHPLGIAADSADLAVDRATGLLLRVTMRFADRAVESYELTRLLLDEPLAPDTFSLEPPAGSPVRAERSTSGRSLAELAAEAPFPIFAPPLGWGSSPWVGMITGRPGGPAAVMLHRFNGRPGRPLTMVEAADAERLPDPAQWRPVDVDGRPGHLWEHEASGTVDLLIHRDGTGIWLRQAPDTATALEIMTSLQPIPRDHAQTP